MCETGIDDILDGIACQECGTYFNDILSGGDPPGYPRTCDVCYDAFEYNDIFVDRED